MALAAVVLGDRLRVRPFAKGTAWSWLPFAVGIPLLPVYGWLGAAGALPAFFAVLVPVAMLAGAALAIANARRRLERDTGGRRRLGRPTRSGRAAAWWLPRPAVRGRAVASAALATPSVAVGAQPAALAGVAAWAALVILVGRAAWAPGRRPGRATGMGVEAVGIAVLAVGMGRRGHRRSPDGQAAAGIG